MTRADPHTFTTGPRGSRRGQLRTLAHNCCWPSRGGHARRWCAGQATVEFALVLPLLVVVACSFVQVGLVVHAQLRLEVAAQAGARAAARNPTSDAARRGVQQVVDLNEYDASVQLHVDGTAPRIATVTVHGNVAVKLPFIGAAARRLDLRARAASAIESPG